MLMASWALASFMGMGSFCLFLGTVAFDSEIGYNSRLAAAFKVVARPLRFARSMKQLELVQGVSDCH